jgi:hypothetical protein
MVSSEFLLHIQSDGANVVVLVDLWPVIRRGSCSTGLYNRGFFKKQVFTNSHKLGFATSFEPQKE